MTNTISSFPFCPFPKILYVANKFVAQIDQYIAFFYFFVFASTTIKIVPAPEQESCFIYVWVTTASISLAYNNSINVESVAEIQL